MRLKSAARSVPAAGAAFQQEARREFRDPYPEKIERLEAWARAGKNVLLRGDRGVGKTRIVQAVAEKLNLNLVYFSAPTLDPWADLVGVPVPQDGKLGFLRPDRVSQAEFLFLDELNRAHPRVQNAVFELIQFHSLNGERLPRLRTVWAAVNPPGGDYQVYDLDPALTDRFHAYLDLPYQPSPAFFYTRFDERIAQCLLEWWHADLNDDQRKKITPRRLEMLGEAHAEGLLTEDVLPFESSVPLHLLVRALGDAAYITYAEIVAHPQRFVRQVQEDLDMAQRLLHLLDVFSHDELYQVRELVLALPPEVLAALVRRHNTTYQKMLKAIRVREKNAGATAFARLLAERCPDPECLLREVPG